MGSDLTVTYKVVLAQDDLISIEFNDPVITRCGSSKFSSDVTQLRSENGKMLKLSDLFKPGLSFCKPSRLTASPI